MIMIDVQRVLAAKNVRYSLDEANPTFTALIDDGGMIDACCEDGPGWEVLSYDQEFFETVDTPVELEAAMDRYREYMLNLHKKV